MAQERAGVWKERWNDLRKEGFSLETKTDDARTRTLSGPTETDPLWVQMAPLLQPQGSAQTAKPWNLWVLLACPSTHARAG